MSPFLSICIWEGMLETDWQCAERGEEAEEAGRMRTVRKVNVQNKSAATTIQKINLLSPFLILLLHWPAS
jgi:hypothetical protein